MLCVRRCSRLEYNVPWFAVYLALTKPICQVTTSNNKKAAPERSFGERMIGDASTDMAFLLPPTAHRSAHRSSRWQLRLRGSAVTLLLMLEALQFTAHFLDLFA